MVRGAVNDIDDSIFEAAMRKGMQYVKDPDVARHLQACVPIKP